MFVSRAAAQRLLLLLKGRSLILMPGDKNHAFSPFAYDKKFFNHLRADQVPRFLRCITDPQKLPTRVFKFDNIHALQDRVDVDKVESIRSSAPGLKPPVVVKIRNDGHWTIADGLHRSTADWLDGMEEAVFHFADLADKRETVEPVPGAGQFDRRADEAQFRPFDRSET